MQIECQTSEIIYLTITSADQTKELAGLPLLLKIS